MPNMHPYITNDEKRVIVRLHEYGGLNAQEIADSTGRGLSTVYRTLALHRDTGLVSNRVLPQGRSRKLGPLEVQFLQAYVERSPDKELSEVVNALNEECGVVVSESTVSRYLHQLGFTRKKITRTATERDENQRTLYCQHMLVYDAIELVFVDESAFNRRSTMRQFGWAPAGDRARRRDFFVKGVKYSMLPALSLDGILHVRSPSLSWIMPVSTSRMS